MHLVDSNIWFALHIPAHQFHKPSQEWLDTVGRESALFCRFTQQAFLRLLTMKSPMELHNATPLGNKAAWAVYEGVREDHRTGWADEPRGLEPVWKRFSSDPRPSPNFWMDPYRAAFAVAGGYKLVTADKGFKQFKNLDLVLIQ